MLARWWLVLQAEVKSLCGHRKEGEDGSGSIRPALDTALSLLRATWGFWGLGLPRVGLITRLIPSLTREPHQTGSSPVF